MEATLDGKRIGYGSTTVFLVQVKRGVKASYKTKYKIVGDFGKAFLWYKGINVGNGYIKRLMSPNMNKPVICRQAS